MKYFVFATENENKQYLVKRTKCGHYYVNQIIHGKVWYKRWEKVTKWYLKTFIENIKLV